MLPRSISKLHISLIHATPTHVHQHTCFMLLTASAFQYEMLFLNRKDVSISLQIVFILYLATHCELECKRRWRGRRKDNMCEEAKDNVNHINNLKQFSGHKFVWDQLWRLVTQSWIVGGLEKRSISAFFGCNLHTLNFFWFLFFLAAQLFLTIGLWVRPFDTVGFQESYQSYCEMKCNYVSVSGCEPKGVWLKLNE